MVSSDRLGLGENIVDGPLYECVVLFLALVFSTLHTSHHRPSPYYHAPKLSPSPGLYPLTPLVRPDYCMVRGID